MNLLCVRILKRTDTTIVGRKKLGSLGDERRFCRRLAWRARKIEQLEDEFSTGPSRREASDPLGQRLDRGRELNRDCETVENDAFDCPRQHIGTRTTLSVSD
jgi:hypothetical protein